MAVRWLGRVAVLLVVALVVAVGVKGAHAGDAERASLKSVKAMDLVVEGLDEKLLVHTALTDELVEGQVKLKLRQNNVSMDPSADPWLYVNVNSLYIDARDAFAYSITIELYQDVRLESDNSFQSAATWSTGGIGFCSAEVARSAILEAIDDYLTPFINDFHESKK